MSSIWDKVTGKEEAHPARDQPKPPLHNDAHPPPEATTQAAPHRQEESSFSFSKMKDALVGHSPGAKQPELPPAVPVTHVEHKAPVKEKEWHEKVKDLLDHGVSNKHEAEEEKLKLERVRQSGVIAGATYAAFRKPLKRR
jgi:hypothetical protein